MDFFMGFLLQKGDRMMGRRRCLRKLNFGNAAESSG
jgi:hypothetical protein